MSESARSWFVYVLRCSDGSLYTGATNDIDRRLAQHQQGKAAKYTRGRRPVRLAARSGPLSRAEALRLEHAVKRLRPREKLAALTRRKTRGGRGGDTLAHETT